MMPRRDPRYENARRHFDDLDMEAQAQFLIEATASTLAQGVLYVGQALADGIEDLFREARRGPSHAAQGPGAAEPETSQRRAPRSGRSHPDDA